MVDGRVRHADPALLRLRCEWVSGSRPMIRTEWRREGGRQRADSTRRARSGPADDPHKRPPRIVMPDRPEVPGVEVATGCVWMVTLDESRIWKSYRAIGK